MASIGNLVVTISATTKPFVRGLQTAAASLKAFSAATVATVGTVSSQFLSLGTVLVGMGSGAFIAGIVKATTELGSSLSDMSARTGVSAEALGKLKFAAEQSDVAFESLGQAFRFQATFMEAARTGTDDAVATMLRLRLTLQDLQRLSPEARFKKFADALSKVSDVGQRTVLAMQIFGRSAQELLPLISEGAEGIDALEKAAEGLGILTNEEAANLEKLGDAFDALWTTIKTNTSRFVAQFAPAIIDGISAVINAAQDMGVIIGVTLSELHSNWRNIFRDMGTIAVASLEWVWDTAKTIGKNIQIAFENLVPIMKSVWSNISTDLAIQYSRATAIITGRSAADQAAVENKIRQMNERLNRNMMRGVQTQPFEALPSLEFPAEIPAIEGFADRLDAALEESRAGRHGLPLSNRAFFADDSEDMFSRRNAAESATLGVATRGSSEAYRLIAEAMNRGTADPVVSAVQQQTAQLLVPLQQIGAGLVGAGGLGVIVPDLIGNAP